MANCESISSKLACKNEYVASSAVVGFSCSCLIHRGSRARTYQTLNFKLQWTFAFSSISTSKSSFRESWFVMARIIHTFMMFGAVRHCHRPSEPPGLKCTFEMHNKTIKQIVFKLIPVFWFVTFAIARVRVQDFFSLTPSRNECSKLSH